MMPAYSAMHFIFNTVPEFAQINKGDRFLGNVSIVPNPYTGSGNGIEIRWDFGTAPWNSFPNGAPTGTVKTGIYNINGELIRQLSGTLEDAKLDWDAKTVSGRPASPGLYIAVMQAKRSGGIIEMSRQKIAITR